MTTLLYALLDLVILPIVELYDRAAAAVAARLIRWDRIEAEIADAYEDGWKGGHKDGSEAGRKDGHRSGYLEGHSDGERTGRAQGEIEGKKEGRAEGYRVGAKDGRAVGYNVGYDAGRAMGRMQGRAAAEIEAEHARDKHHGEGFREAYDRLHGQVLAAFDTVKANREAAETPSS